ncbi:MAG: bacteriohemerythrin [Pseudomonadota bacterium]
MALLVWREEYSTGIEDVDYEHRELIDLINGLYTRLSKKGSSITVLEFLGEIYARISAHFALEEKIMRERKYDQYEDHKEDHERLLDEIRDIMDDYENRAFFNEQTFAESLNRWFVDHFRSKDARFHKYLK